MAADRVGEGNPKECHGYGVRDIRVVGFMGCCVCGDIRRRVEWVNPGFLGEIGMWISERPNT